VWVIGAIIAAILFFVQISVIKERRVPEPNIFPADMREGEERIGEIFRISGEKKEGFWKTDKEEKLEELIKEEKNKNNG